MRLLVLIVLGIHFLLPTAVQPSFTVVPLGVKGGLQESNLSAYLIAPAGSSSYVCLDAGTVYSGVEKAVASQALVGPASRVIRTHIKGYLISHPHLDHVAGLLLGAPDDTAKTIYGLSSCLATLQSDYLNWRAWPNFGSGGSAPALRKYRLQELAPGQETPLANTDLSVQAFPLSHGKPYQSTAFLVRSGSSYLLYLGDTGADAVEQSTSLRTLWRAVQPLVQTRQLKAIFLEASYPNSQPHNQLFGHLTPALLLQELQVLSQLTGAAALRGLPVVITHLKPGNEAAIQAQLREGNRLPVRLVFPEQGQRLEF